MSVGTKAVGYAGPELGPFKCCNCKHFVPYEDGCNEPEVREDPELYKLPSGNARVEAEGCCNEFEPGHPKIAILEVPFSKLGV